MALKPAVSNLPYHLPKNSKGQSRELGKILRIPSSVIEDGGDQAIEAICATILYRHLDQVQRREAMALIKSLPSRQLQGLLMARVLDTMVNPQWGLWSLTTEELIADETFHNNVATIGGTLGVTVSAMGSKDLIKTLWLKRKVTSGGLATVVIWIAFAGNWSSLQTTQKELERRTSQPKSSPFFQ
ncbi:hypothetical protein [Marinobacter caseinilyticus]|uniref:hypothetical protein n=1 Tax=Marinobacter caseinilyticus TaxID=2692195 RepID=UPI00140985A6|nr:hypothetical protein [Marinobacter caseinilyticus]